MSGEYKWQSHKINKRQDKVEEQPVMEETEHEASKHEDAATGEMSQQVHLETGKLGKLLLAKHF